jgi:hypothetical protein
MPAMNTKVCLCYLSICLEPRGVWKGVGKRLWWKAYKKVDEQVVVEAATAESKERAGVKKEK